MSGVRWVRNTKTGNVFAVPEGHWSLTDATYEHQPTPAEHTPAPPITDYLPDDFPAREQLAAYGFTTVSSLDGMTLDKLTALKGIGVTRARAVLEALA